MLLSCPTQSATGQRHSPHLECCQPSDKSSTPSLSLMTGGRRCCVCVCERERCVGWIQLMSLVSGALVGMLKSYSVLLFPSFHCYAVLLGGGLSTSCVWLYF